MSDLNILYSSVKNNTNNNTAAQQQSSDTATSGTASRKDEDKDLNQSILKAYFDKLRTKSDDQAKKLFSALENAPADRINKLFGSLQIKNAEQLEKMFDDLRQNPSEDVDGIMGMLRGGQVDKAEKADKVDEVDKTDETDKPEKEDKTESAIQKFIHKSMSKESKDLDKRAEKLEEASEKLKKAIEEKHAEEAGSDTAYKAAKNFVNSYNSLNDAIKDSKVGAVSGKAKFIEDMTKSFADRLEKVGIERDENGDLTIDKDKFDYASDRDREKALGKKDSFTEFMEEQAKQLTAFAQKDVFQRASAYNNGGNITNVSEINGAFFNMLG